MNKEEEPEEIVVEGFFYKEPSYTFKLFMADTCVCFIVFAVGVLSGILLYNNVVQC